MVNKKSPLKQGVIFGIIMLAFSLAWHTYKRGEFSTEILAASAIGGLVGGVVYGGISYFRYK